MWLLFLRMIYNLSHIGSIYYYLKNDYHNSLYIEMMFYHKFYNLSHILNM